MDRGCIDYGYSLNTGNKHDTDDKICEITVQLVFVCCYSQRIAEIFLDESLWILFSRSSQHINTDT